MAEKDRVKIPVALDGDLTGGDMSMSERRSKLIKLIRQIPDECPLMDEIADYFNLQ